MGTLTGSARVAGGDARATALCWIVRAYLRRFPIERGKWRVWTAWRDRPAAQLRGKKRCTTLYGFFMEAETADFIGMNLWYWGVFEPNEARLIHSLLKPGSTFLDVGANIGFMTMVGAKAVGPSGVVIAVEATPETAAQLRANIALNAAHQVEIHAVAASDGPGVVAITRPRPNNIGENRILLDAAGTVPAVRVDDLIGDRRVDLVKIDIEGAELLALRGMRGLMARRDAPAIMVEVTPAWLPRYGGTLDEMLGMFEAHGYALYRIGHTLEPVTHSEIAAERQMMLYAAPQR